MRADELRAAVAWFIEDADADAAVLRAAVERYIAEAHAFEDAAVATIVSLHAELDSHAAAEAEADHMRSSARGRTP